MNPDAPKLLLHPGAGRGRRWLRRVARKLLPPPALTAFGVRAALGLQREHGHPVDCVDGLAVEYSFDSLIGQLLYLHGQFEGPEAEFMGRRLARRSAPVLLDVGANIGLHSLRAAQAVAAGRVYAFEPARETLAMLERNIARNGLTEKIQACPLAVAAHSGRAVFHFCADDAYSSLTPDARRPVQESYEVTVTSLDDWCAATAVGPVDFIKIDVEGGEPAVIDGAAQMLTRDRPELLVEIYQGDRTHFSASALVGKIRALGYTAYVLVDGEPVPYARHDDAHFNYYFAPQPGAAPS